MDETKRAWDEVGEAFTTLGRVVSERYRRLGGERAAQPSAGKEGGVADAVRRAIDELDLAFTSLGDTMRDDETRQHVRDSGRKLSDALKVTFSEIGDEVRRAMGGAPPPGPGAPPPPAPPSEPRPDSDAS